MGRPIRLIPLRVDGSRSSPASRRTGSPLAESQVPADVVHRRFRLLGAAIALAFCTLLLIVLTVAGVLDSWILLVLSIGLVGGALVGELVCTIATIPAVDERDGLQVRGR